MIVAGIALRALDYIIIQPLAHYANFCVVRKVRDAWEVVYVAPRWISRLGAAVACGDLIPTCPESAQFLSPSPVSPPPRPSRPLSRVPRQSRRA